MFEIILKAIIVRLSLVIKKNEVTFISKVVRTIFTVFSYLVFFAL